MFYLTIHSTYIHRRLYCVTSLSTTWVTRGNKQQDIFRMSLPHRVLPKTAFVTRVVKYLNELICTRFSFYQRYKM